MGAGLQVSPNATRILQRLGLGDELARIGVRSEAIHQRRWQDGRTLLRSPLGRTVEQHFGVAHYQCHRGDLLLALAGAFPPERLHLGHRLTGLADHGDRVEAQFANGARASADMLVGADGIHSVVRGILLGPENPRFTNCVAYRGMVPAERVAHLDVENTSTVWMGPGRHFIHYFVSGMRLLNFVALMDHDEWQRESWTDRGDLADVIAAYAGWHPQIRGILDAAEETFIWALFDRAPLPRWSVGRVTLLGDACHPMLPFMAQGAAQAIEDGADARRLPRALRHARHSRDVRAATRRSGCRAPRACKPCRRSTSSASICPTAPSRRRATPRWRAEPPTGRSPPSPGSTATTPAFWIRTMRAPSAQSAPQAEHHDARIAQVRRRDPSPATQFHGPTLELRHGESDELAGG